MFEIAVCERSLHWDHIIHRDLKASNVLITRWENGVGDDLIHVDGVLGIVIAWWQITSVRLELWEQGFGELWKY